MFNGSEKKFEWKIKMVYMKISFFMIIQRLAVRNIIWWKNKRVYINISFFRFIQRVTRKKICSTRSARKIWHKRLNGVHENQLFADRFNFSEKKNSQKELNGIQKSVSLFSFKGSEKNNLLERIKLHENQLYSYSFNR